MSRPLCFIRPDELCDITFRTRDGRGLLRPTAIVTACLLQALARCAQLYSIDIHAFVFLSNHAHLIATLPDAWRGVSFIRELKRSTAVRLRKLYDLDLSVWTSRTRPIPILDDAAAVDRLRYVLSNGVKEGLVAHPLDWPGASSTKALLEDMVVAVPRSPLGDDGDDDPTELRLRPLPAWAQLDRAAQQARARELIADVVHDAAVRRDGKPPLGARQVLAMDPLAPIELEQKPPPVAHCTRPEILFEYLAEREAYTTAYRAAAARSRSVEFPVRFPGGAFRPALGFEAEQDR